MTPAMQEALERLKALPEAAQEVVAARLHDHLNRLDELRAAIQEGADSLDRGEGIPAGEVFDRLEAKFTRKVKEGLAQIEPGQLVSHEEVGGRIEQRLREKGLAGEPPA